PLSRLAAGVRSGLLPALVQAPLLIALYWVILAIAHSAPDLHFLWVANLAIPDPVLLPVLAGLATYLLIRVTSGAQPAPAGDEDGGSVATQRVLAVLSPLGLVVAAHLAPAALALYWLTGSLAGALQQWVLVRLLTPASASPASG
ncbi:MAG TPA: YidC/Oxa1 family membrane protein insertase, partial [Candidatus Dormibacteraeota bacterium]